MDSGNAIYTITFCKVSQPWSCYSNRKLIYYSLLREKDFFAKSFKICSCLNFIWMLNFLSVPLPCSNEQHYIKYFYYSQGRKGCYFWLKLGISTVLLQVNQQWVLWYSTGGAQPLLYMPQVSFCYLCWHKKGSYSISREVSLHVLYITHTQWILISYSATLKINPVPLAIRA